ncbi:hypothetical protein LCGC14_1059540 [marine sediment metagenome]|uniref:Uncharacterized protein n=1 Tax=marine sediment metagenome TaxID=412755 RepID=A0A0F9N8E5_9ZZZZ
MNDCDSKRNSYNCFGVWDDSMCYDCQRNLKSEAETRSDNYISQLDKINILYEYLKGEGMPTGVSCLMPKLKPKKAFSVIWFLQEILHCLPDNIEQCDDCKDLYDTDSEGHILDDQYDLDGKTLPKKYWGHWCDNCVPCVDFEIG